MAQKTVLVVEDDERCAAAYAQLLSSRNMFCEVAQCVEDAVCAFRQLSKRVSYGLVITDLFLPLSRLDLAHGPMRGRFAHNGGLLFLSTVKEELEGWGIIICSAKTRIIDDYGFPPDIDIVHVLQMPFSPKALLSAAISFWESKERSQ